MDGFKRGATGGLTISEIPSRTVSWIEEDEAGNTGREGSTTEEHADASSLPRNPSVSSMRSLKKRFSVDSFSMKRASQGIGSRNRRASAVTFFMRYMVSAVKAGDEGLITSLHDVDAVRKPVVVEFLEKAIAAVLRRSTHKADMTIAECQALMDQHEEYQERVRAREENSDSDGEDSQIEKCPFDGETAGAMHILQSLQDKLMESTNVATLAAMLYTSTFSIKDRRVDDLLGPHVPIKLREVLMLELIHAIDNLWERFGLLLLEQFGSFSASFEHLDKDGSGSIDRHEFQKAYVSINQKASGEPEVASEAGTPMSQGRQRRVRRSQTISSVSMADIASSIQDGGDSEDSQTPKPLRSTKRRNTEDFRGSITGGLRSDSLASGRKSISGISDQSNSAALSRRMSVTATRRQSMARQELSNSAAAVSMMASMQNVHKVNRMILKADADFLFDMLRTGERGLAKADTNEEEDLEVSMPSLVLRLAGLGEKTMEHMRERIMDKFSSLENAFHEFARTNRMEMTSQEFESMYRELRTDKVADGGPDSHESGAKDKARRIFNSIDIDGGGSLSVAELHNALANFAPHTTFSMLRRRILLQYGSYDSFFVHITNSVGWKADDEIVNVFISENDLNHEDGMNFSVKLGLIAGGDRDTRGLHVVPPEGYTPEEFGIAVFLNKPEEATLEDLIKRLGYADQDKDIPFREFSERIVACGQKQPSDSRTPSFMSPNAAPKAGISKLKVVIPKSNTLNVEQRRSKFTTQRPSTIMMPSHLPAGCRLNECRMVYEAMQREHRRVSVNILMHSLQNFSDIIALDRNTYQSGDRIVCRIRLSSEALKKCKEMPVLAVVPERLEYRDQGAKSHWSIDEEKIVDLMTICDRVYELPRSSNGNVKKESCLKLSVPYLVNAIDNRYEVRLFASSNGKEPGKQIGKGVAFDLLMPRPSTPLVDQVSLNAANGEASVVLHWSAPHGKFKESPIMNFLLQVEPLIYRHELLAEAFEAVDYDDDNSDGDEVSDTDLQEVNLIDDVEVPGLQEVVVWSPALKGFTKKLSYRIDGLQRGVQYRFGVQCTHSSQQRNSNEGRQEIRGAPSELSDIVTMPLYNVTEAPGQPEASVRENGMIEIVWQAPADEGLSDSNRICNYIVQYRPTANSRRWSARASYAPGEALSDCESSTDSDFDSDSSTSAKDDKGDNDFHDDKGWVTVEECSIYISQPRFVDFQGWIVVAHIDDLKAIDGETDFRPHEFRVCAVNYAGNSPWSKASKCIPLNTPRVESKINDTEVAVTNLEVLEQHGVKVPGLQAYERGQVVLRWDQPTNCDTSDMPKYSVQARDVTQARGEGGWIPMDAYILYPTAENNRGGRRGSNGTPSTGTSQIRAVVTGLQRYPSFATLAVQVRATSSLGSGVAEVQIEGLEFSAPPIPSEAPAVVQALHSNLGTTTLELEWPQVEMPDLGPTKRMQYVLQVAHAEKPINNKELEFGDFRVVENPCIVSSTHGKVICFARDFTAEGFYVFRLGVCYEGETPQDYSPVSHPPFEMSRRHLLHHNHANKAMSEEERAKQDALKPKKPRDVQILQADAGWCQISWEQRVKKGGEMPDRYEVEECREGVNDNVWQPVESCFVLQEDLPTVEGNLRCLAKAAVFFQNREDEIGQAMQAPRWRVRVRAQVEGCDWSAPSAWQQPPQPPVPPQPSVPSIIRNEQQFYVLEWIVPEVQGSDGNHYELQMQTQQQRRGGKVTDWTPVTAYTQTISVSDGAAQSTVRALVERRTAADIAKAHLSSMEDTIRFRVRITRDGEVTGQPSGPSAFVPLQLTLPPIPAPPQLALVGSGRIVMETPEGSLLENEFVRLQWAMPSAEVDGEPDTDNSVEGIKYELEARDEDHGFWMPMLGALFELDRRAGTASSLVPLPPTGGVSRQTRFRVATSHRKGSEATYSPLSPLVSWGCTVEVVEPPQVVHVVPTAIVVHFVLPISVVRAGICSISAVLEVAKPRRRHFRTSAASLWSSLTASSQPPSSPSSPKSFKSVDDILNQDEDETMFEFDDYDDSEEGREEQLFDMVGEFPISWRDSISGDVRHQTDDSPDDRPNGIAMSTNTSACHCEAVLMLDGRTKGTPCVPGDYVRIALRVGTFDMEEGELSEFSNPTVVSEMIGKTCADLQLEYPSWQPIVAKGIVCNFVPRFFSGSRSDELEEMRWCREAIRTKDGSQRIHFEVSRGRLPKGLTLEPDTGRIRGVGDEDFSPDSFTVQARVLATWPGRTGVPVVVGTAASTTLKCTLMLEEGYVDVVRDICKKSAEDDFAAQGLSIPSILQFITNREILSMNATLLSVMEGEAGVFALGMVNKVLHLPADALIVSAEMPEEDIFARLFGDDDSTSSYSSSDGARDDKDDSHSTGSCSSDGEGSAKVESASQGDGSNSRSSRESPGTSPTYHSEGSEVKSPASKSSRWSSSTQPAPDPAKLDPNAQVNSHALKTAGSISFANEVEVEETEFFLPGEKFTPQHSTRMRYSSELSDASDVKKRKSAAGSRRHSICYGPSKSTGSPVNTNRSRRQSLRIQAQSIKALASRVRSNSVVVTNSAELAALNIGSKNGKLEKTNPRRMSHAHTSVDFDTLYSSLSAVAMQAEAHSDSEDSDNSRRSSKVSSKTRSSRKSSRRSSKVEEERAEKKLSVLSTTSGVKSKSSLKGKPCAPRGSLSDDVPFSVDFEATVKSADGESPSNRSKSSKSSLSRRQSKLLEETEFVMCRNIEICYPGLTPLWPAFTDVDFSPTITLDDMPVSDGVEYLFSISPALPANVSIDPSTGIISGSPLAEHVAGRQYTISARWKETGHIAGSCTVAFAVVRADVASVCNAAYLGTEPPAFRSDKVNSVAVGQSPHGTLPAVRALTDIDRDEIFRPHLLVDGYEKSGISASTSVATPRPMPPFNLDGDPLSARASATSSHKASPPNWKSKYGMMQSAYPEKTSRTTVFPLGPPLRNREPMDSTGSDILSKPSSNRPLLCELYETRANELIPTTHRTQSQGLSSVRMPIAGGTGANRAVIGPNSKHLRPLGR